MKIAIYGRVLKRNHLSFVQELYDSLSSLGIEYATEDVFLAQCINNNIKVKSTNTFTDKQELVASDPDYLMVLGGDGTMLDSLVYIYETSIPVMGINLGRLGFLTGQERDDVPKLLDHLMRGYVSIEKRTLLKLESDHHLFNGIPYALNDFVIHKKDSSSMMTIHTYLNGEFLNSYWADGLILSTPTGSTGYSLSCGGPILYPGSNSFVITPIAPHNLNVRPFVISDEHVISFEIEDRSTSFLVTLDSRSETIHSSVNLAIRKADYSYHLLNFQDENFLTTLRKKLMWGIDNRNL
jgi:NAD+ kinase